MSLELNLDLTAAAPANYIPGEVHTITDSPSRYWVPTAGCFYTLGLQLRRVSDNYLLRPGIDYKALHFIPDAANLSGKEVCAIIWVINTDITGDIAMSYHAVGGIYSATTDALNALLVNLASVNSSQIAWAQVVGAPAQFPPAPHSHNIADWYGMGGLITALEDIRQAIGQGDIATIEMIYQYIDIAIANLASSSNIMTSDAVAALITQAMQAHLAANPSHTPDHVGLGNVPNWAPLLDSDATVTGSTGKTQNFMNPVQILSLIQDRVTKTWLGLDQLPNYGAAAATDVVTGTAANKLMTVASTMLAIANVFKSNSAGAGSASASARPIFAAKFDDVNPPTNNASGAVTGIVIQFFTENVGTDVPTTALARTQIAFISGGTNANGIWKNSFDGTSWTGWTAAGSIASSGFSKIKDYPLATLLQGLTGTDNQSYLTPKTGVAAAIAAFALNTVDDPNTSLTPVIISTGANGPCANCMVVTFPQWPSTGPTVLPTSQTTRTQLAFGLNPYTGVWRRSYAGADGTPYNASLWNPWVSLGIDDTSTTTIGLQANMNLKAVNYVGYGLGDPAYTGWPNQIYGMDAHEGWLAIGYNGGTTSTDDHLKLVGIDPSNQQRTTADVILSTLYADVPSPTAGYYPNVYGVLITSDRYTSGVVGSKVAIDVLERIPSATNSSGTNYGYTAGSTTVQGSLRRIVLHPGTADAPVYRNKFTTAGSYMQLAMARNLEPKGGRATTRRTMLYAMPNVVSLADYRLMVGVDTGTPTTQQFTNRGIGPYRLNGNAITNTTNTLAGDVDIAMTDANADSYSVKITPPSALISPISIDIIPTEDYFIVDTGNSFILTQIDPANNALYGSPSTTHALAVGDRAISRSAVQIMSTLVPTGVTSISGGTNHLRDGKVDQTTAAAATIYYFALTAQGNILVYRINPAWGGSPTGLYPTVTLVGTIPQSAILQPTQAPAINWIPQRVDYYNGVLWVRLFEQGVGSGITSVVAAPYIPGVTGINPKFKFIGYMDEGSNGVDPGVYGAFPRRGFAATRGVGIFANNNTMMRVDPAMIDYFKLG